MSQVNQRVHIRSANILCLGINDSPFDRGCSAAQGQDG